MKTYNKDQPYIISDNVEALQLIVDRGLLNDLKPIPGANSSFHSYHTDDHYCMVSHHIEHGDDKDNGYMVVMVPKNSWTSNRAARFFADCIAHNTKSISYEYKELPEKQNN